MRLDSIHLAHARNKAGWYLIHEFACSAGTNRMVTCLNNMMVPEGRRLVPQNRRAGNRALIFQVFMALLFSEPGQVAYRLYWLLLNKLTIIRWADIFKKTETLASCFAFKMTCSLLMLKHWCPFETLESKIILVKSKHQYFDNHWINVIDFIYKMRC